jgi:hypothetical protein
MERVRVAGIIFCMVAIALFAACEGDQGPAGPAGPAGPEGPGTIIGYATVLATNTPSIRVFGGADTDSVFVTRLGPGEFEVRFFGKYEPFTSKNELTVVASLMEGATGDHVAVADFTQGGGSQADGSEFWTNVIVFNTNSWVRANLDFSVVVLR